MRDQTKKVRYGEPVGERADGTDLHADAGSALQTAAARIQAIASDLTTEILPTDDVADELRLLLQLIQDARHAGPDERPDPGVTALRRRLLEALRSETVREWKRSGELPTSQDMLRILSGFERAQSFLDQRTSDDFIGKLLEPRGLDLLLEVAHDLRSPLTSILFLSETMLRGQSGPLADVQLRQLGIIYSAALGLINTASDVIEYAQGGVTDAERSPFSIAELLDSVREIVRPMAEEKRVIVNLTCSTESDRRLGHPVSLSRVLLNLTTNALKFTEEGTVELSARDTECNRVEFAVRDTGPGISEEAMSTLYRPFRRSMGGRSDYHFSGTGLGLSICRRLVKLMGAELALETHAGRGTRFYFDVALPFARHQ